MAEATEHDGYTSFERTQAEGVARRRREADEKAAKARALKALAVEKKAKAKKAKDKDA